VAAATIGQFGTFGVRKLSFRFYGASPKNKLDRIANLALNPPLLFAFIPGDQGLVSTAPAAGAFSIGRSSIIAAASFSSFPL
jgi:hypothetical protein